MPVEVRALCEKYGIPFHEASMPSQLRGVWKKARQLALPDTDYTASPTESIAEIVTLPARTVRRELGGVA